MLKGHPCKVIDYSTAKPGKHGSAKASIVGTDIFTGKKHEDGAPTSATMYVPTVVKNEYEVADLDEEDFCSLILDDGSLKEDLKLPVDLELNAELRKAWEENNEKSQVFFTVITAVGQNKIIAVRIKDNE